MIFNHKVICIFLFVLALVPSSFATPEELIELLQIHEQWEMVFENASLKEAEKIWSHEEDVIVIDLMGFKAVGWKQVRRQLALGFAVIGRSNLVTWDAVVSVVGDRGSVAGKYIIEGVLLNKTFKATELYRRENGQWRLYYDDAKGFQLPQIAQPFSFAVMGGTPGFPYPY